jgi:hypothetical protein
MLLEIHLGAASNIFDAVYTDKLLRWIFRKWEGVVGTGWSGLRIGTRGGHLWVRQ